MSSKCEFKRSEFDHGSPIAQDTFCPLFLVCTTAEKQPANIDNNNLCTQKWPVGLAWKSTVINIGVCAQTETPHRHVDKSQNI